MKFQMFIGLLFIILTSSLNAHEMTIQYQYDNLNRIIRVDYGDGTVIEYTYDAVGNRETHVIQVPTVVTTVSIPAGNPPAIPVEDTQITLDFNSGTGGEVTVQEITGYPPALQQGTKMKSTALASSSLPDAAGRYWEITTDMTEGTYTTILKIAYDLNDFPTGLTEEEAVIYYFNPDLSQYFSLPTERDTENDTLWTQDYLDHVGRFAIGDGGSQITTLVASVQGNNILLEWTPVTGATGYNVYRGTSCNFIPDLAGGSNRIAETITDEDPGTEDVQWTDTGNGADIVGNINTNYFWHVTAVSGIESDPSNLAGEFDYNLVTTGTTDINEIVVLMNTRNTRLRITTAEALAQAIPYCTDVYFWNTQGQGTVGHVKGLPFNNFEVLAGYPYIVNVSSDTVWTVAGSYADISYNLITTSGTNINHLGVPLSKGMLASAEALGQDMPNCTDVYYWDAAGQGTVGHVVGLPFGDFAVNAGYPYYVNVTAATEWPTAAGLNLLLSKAASQDSLKPAVISGLVSGGVPHTVYGKIEFLDRSEIDSLEYQIKAWVLGRPDEILTQENVSVGFGQGYWWVGVSDFATGWRIGESLHVEFGIESLSLRGETVVKLTDGGSDDGGSIVLSTLTDVFSVSSREIPQEFLLYQNYPNPFNPVTQIRYGLPETAHVKVVIYDISGREVKTLIEGKRAAGYHQIIWNGKDTSGQKVSSGLYLCRMQAGDFMKTVKLIVTK